MKRGITGRMVRRDNPDSSIPLVRSCEPWKREAMTLARHYYDEGRQFEADLFRRIGREIRDLQVAIAELRSPELK